MKETLSLRERFHGHVWLHRNWGTIHPRHHHNELELNLVTRGSGTYLVEDRTYRMQRNDLLWLFPEQEHVLIDMSPDWSMWIIVWTPTLVKLTVADSADAKTLKESAPKGHFCSRLTNPSAARLADLCDEMIAHENDPAHYNAGLSYALMAAWNAFRAGTEVPVGAVLHPAVEQAARLLRHQEAAYSLPQLARKTGLSASRLSRLFTRQIGMPLVEYRNRQRLERFHSLLAHDPKGNLLELALEAGFGSYPQFHRVFSRLHECSPAQFVELKRGQRSPK